jgi:phage tail-like protein
MANEYPLPKFHFQVDWGGAKMAFTEVTGLDMEREVIEYREGSSKEYSKLKMPGLTKYSNITLKRGSFKGDTEFYKWWGENKLETVQRRNITISLLNEEHQPVISWKIKNAWASKVQATELKSDDNSVAIETMEVVHEGITVE